MYFHYLNAKFDKIRVRRQLTPEGIIRLPAFQEFNHVITQTQVFQAFLYGSFHAPHPSLSDW